MEFSVNTRIGNRTTKIFKHNLGTTDINVQVFSQEVDSEGVEVHTRIIPESIRIIDLNTISISFLQSTTGFVVIGYAKREEEDDIDNIITNVSEVPYSNPTYSKINSVGHQWIFWYTLALARELLAYVRGKYTTVPIPDSETTLNQADLLSDARSEKQRLIEQLKDMLDGTSRTAQLEKKAQEAEYVNKTLQGVPMVIYIG